MRTDENPFPRIDITLRDIAIYVLGFGFDCYDWVMEKAQKSHKGINVHPKVLDASEFMYKFDKAMEDAVKDDELEQRWKENRKKEESKND